MKYLTFLCSITLFIFGCSDDSTSNQGQELNFEREISFIHNGEKLSITVDLKGNEPEYVQNKNFSIINEVLSSDNSVVYINPKNDFPVIFEDDISFHEYMIKEQKNDNYLIKAKSKVEQSLSNPYDYFWESNFTIYEHELFGGRSFVSHLNGGSSNAESYSSQNPNLKTCEYFGFSFNDKISSLKLKNCYLVLYEHINYEGKKIILDYRQYGTYNMEGSYSNLGAVKFRSFYEEPGTVGNISHCNTSWFCSNWGDEISSFYGTYGKIGSLTPNPNLDPACGNTGGGGGGGTLPTPPDEQLPIK